MRAGWHERDPWWDIVVDDSDKQKELDSDYQEVLDEMIRQEKEAGKRAPAIAEEYGIHFTTVYKMDKRAKERL